MLAASPYLGAAPQRRMAPAQGLTALGGPPTTQEVTPPHAHSQVAAVAAQPQAVALAQQQQAAFAQPQQPMAFASLPQQQMPFAAPQQQAQAIVPVPAHPGAPEQGQGLVPGQGAFAVAPQATVTAQGLPGPTAAAVPTAQASPDMMNLSAQQLQSLNPEDVEALCQRVEALKVALEARRGAPLPPISPACP